MRWTLVLFFFLAACAVAPPAPEKLTLTPVNFSNLRGWNEDRQGEAIGALQRSCAAREKKGPDEHLGIAGKVSDWLALCVELAHAPPQNDADARAFFEKWFRPFAASGRTGRDGLFTGYYEAMLRGAWRQSDRYQVPLWRRPQDLITVDLGDFKPKLKGQKLEGKVVKDHLKPYDERAAIVQNSLSGRAETLLWVDDPIDAFFLEIQGSGRVQMQDGSTVRVGYDAPNGRQYMAIGRMLAEEGEIGKPVTMQQIRAWLKTHPGRAQEIMNKNASYVFFRKIDGDGPIGAEGVALTPMRSLAVDPAFVPLGIPLWIDTEAPRLQKLVISQDTGGAIKGPVRGDFFWGFGSEAEEQAGAMQSGGQYYLLLPKQITDIP